MLQCYLGNYYVEDSYTVYYTTYISRGNQSEQTFRYSFCYLPAMPGTTAVYKSVP